MTEDSGDNAQQLVLSTDYRMSKLVLYWECSPQPGSTYYMPKVSYDLLGIVDHRNEAGFIYTFELIGRKNTDHTISYLQGGDGLVEYFL